MRDLIVNKDNKLLKASYKLSVLEKRVVAYGISKINPCRQAGQRIAIDLEEFKELFKLNDEETKDLKKRLKTALFEDIFQRQISIKSEDGKYQSVGRWISNADYDENTGVFSFYFNVALEPYLIQLKAPFTKYRLQQIASLRSIYSIRFYEVAIMALTASRKNCVAFKKTIGELKEMLSITDQYKLLSNFRARCLEPAINEINTHTDITLTYEFDKIGKKVNAIIFTATYKNGMPKEELTESKPEREGTNRPQPTRTTKTAFHPSHRAYNPNQNDSLDTIEKINRCSDKQLLAWELSSLRGTLLRWEGVDLDGMGDTSFIEKDKKLATAMAQRLEQLG